MDVELLKLFAQFGAIGLFAGLTLLIAKKLADTHETHWKEHSERWERLSADLREVVRANTVAFTQALGMIQTMQKQIDRWDGVDRRERRPRTGGAA